MAVYTVKYPLEIAALIKYCEVVRDIANKSGNREISRGQGNVGTLEPGHSCHIKISTG